MVIIVRCLLKIYFSPFVVFSFDLEVFLCNRNIILFSSYIVNMQFNAWCSGTVFAREMYF